MVVTASNAVGGRYRDYLMPDIGEGLTEGEILSWRVAEGDTVTDGQIVCEVETAKAAVELPIPFDGTVRTVHHPEGSTVPVGAPIITVDTDPSAGPEEPPAVAAGAESASAAAAAAAGDGAAAEAESDQQSVLVGYGPKAAASGRRPRRGAAAGGAAPAPAPTAAPAPEPAPAPATAPAPVAAGVNGTASANGAGPALAKPPVRKLAKDLGVDLRQIRPTGPGGIVTREDVHAHAEAASAPVPAAAPVTAAATAAAAGGEQRIPVRGVRKATAAAVVGSAFTAPHVTEFHQVDVTRTMKLVRRLKESPDFAGVRVSPLLVVAKAFLTAIRRHPEINASWDEANQEIVLKERVNLGFAAATPRGLTVPNIKGADRLTLRELAGELNELVGTAKDGLTQPAAMRGGTATITNVGVFGIDSGTPILNPGESVILALGAIRELPWVHKGKVKPRQVTTLALSFDHRLVDGELGSKVLADTAAVLEHPKRLLLWS